MNLLPPVEPRRKPPVFAILEAICSEFDITEQALLSHSRFTEMVRPRQAAMLLLRHRGDSLPQIAQHLERADHTTVLQGCRAAATLFVVDSVFASRTRRAWARAEEIGRAHWRMIGDPLTQPKTATFDRAAPDWRSMPIRTAAL